MRKKEQKFSTSSTSGRKPELPNNIAANAKTYKIKAISVSKMKVIPPPSSPATQAHAVLQQPVEIFQLLIA